METWRSLLLQTTHMIDWDDDLPPLEQLHAEAALISLDCELREAEVKAECLRWWAANPERYLSLRAHYEERIAPDVAKG